MRPVIIPVVGANPFPFYSDTFNKIVAIGESSPAPYMPSPFYPTWGPREVPKYPCEITTSNKTTPNYKEVKDKLLRF